ncbi:MAG TPA: phosphatase PAP2 family protein, partial [Patescibacteria group bacterium]|nr:phosphatase PAP2 family protein [Patescibacteria group bacterium]
IVGLIGTLVYIGIFIRTPSFPTPDKILIFATLVAMTFGQALELLKRFVPFVVLLLLYESFRGFATQLNTRVNYLFMPRVDRLLAFGHLPTAVLQQWWWHGHVTLLDFAFYGAYTLHFVLPFALAALIWKTKDSYYWTYVSSILIASFMGFVTFLAFPAAPPWLASDHHLIQPLTHISSAIWAAFGIHDFPSVYNKITPNPVAAVPSLHAAYSFLFAFTITRLYKTKWRWLAWVYPALIWIGTVYMGEHYVFDILVGVLYAFSAYLAAPYLVRALRPLWLKIWPAKHSRVNMKAH